MPSDYVPKSEAVSKQSMQKHWKSSSELCHLQVSQSLIIVLLLDDSTLVRSLLALEIALLVQLHQKPVVLFASAELVAPAKLQILPSRFCLRFQDTALPTLGIGSETIAHQNRTLSLSVVHILLI